MAIFPKPYLYRNDEAVGFSHIDKSDNPAMVDVGHKDVTLRIATARCVVSMPDNVARELRAGAMQTKKGAVEHTAILAGVMGAKQTGTLIPLCHPLALEDCQVALRWTGDAQLEVRCTAKMHGKTGVEMEALTGAGIAALTIYDMCKALSHDITITDLQLISKTGGKHDFNRETS